MRGMRPLSKVDLVWSCDMAYVIGLITADGSLSIDGRHIDITSVDKSQLDNALRCLKLSVKIGRKK